MRVWTRLPALYHNEHDRTHNRNEVQRQIHAVSNQGLGTETVEGILQDLAQPCHGITPRLQLSALTDNIGGIPSHQRAIKCV